MPIVGAKIIKIIDERETQKRNKAKQKKRTRGTEAKAKAWEINDFVECLS